MPVTLHQKWFAILSSIFLFSCSFISISCQAQLFENKKGFTHQDTLRGTITPGRAWWDVMQYTIHIKPDYNNKTTTGYSQISFKTIEKGRKMQVDLQEPLAIDSVIEERPRIAKRGEKPYINYSHPFTRDG